MKYELGCCIKNRNFKSLSYLIGGKVKIENQKTQGNVSSKENLNLKITKNCLEATQLDNKIII